MTSWSSRTVDLARSASALTIGRVLENQTAIRPDDVAVEYPGGSFTFAQLDRASNRVAHALSARGIRGGDRIAVTTDNSVELCVLLYAAAKLGATVAVLNWRVRPDELGYCTDLVEPALVCFSHERAALVEEALADAATRAPRVRLGRLDDTGADTLLGSATGCPDSSPGVDVDPEAVLTILYTSGSTGRPKAAAISHRALVARAGVMGTELRLSREDAFLGWAPMFHMVSTDYMFITHIYGGTFIVVPGFDPELIVDWLYRTRIGWFVLMPGSIEPIIDLLERRGKPVVGVRAVGAMADLVPPDQLRRLTDLLDAPYFNSFGSTECGTVPSAGALLPAGERPVSFAKDQTAFCDSMLVDPNGNPVAPGEVGELLVRGPTMFSGYWNDDAATQAAFAGGAYHTGDLFERIADGRLNFVARSKYMIKSGGESIYPAEIERVLLQHPAVVETVVVRRADPKWGEVPIAVVAVADPAPAADELARFAADRLAGFKRPKAIVFRALDEFPRNVTGKVLRDELEKEIGAMAEATAW